MVKVKCPKCGMKYQFVKCTNCHNQDGLLSTVVVLSRSNLDEKGAFCAKCNIGATALKCECGCHIEGALFSEGGFSFYSKKHDLAGNLI